MESTESTPAACAECLAPGSAVFVTRTGEAVCEACAAEHYAECGGCHKLVARDEAKERDGVAYCLECLDELFALPDDADLEALVAEYVRLTAEEKKLSDRIEQIKDKLRATASVRERIGGAVTLGSGDTTVRCSYSTRYKCDPEKVLPLETLLGEERFASLFERKVAVSAVKTNLEKVLGGAGDDPLRDAVRDAVEITEVPTITVPRAKK